MKLWDLCPDLSIKIQEELWKIRYKEISKQLKKEWYNKNINYKVHRSFRYIHPGRLFINEEVGPLISNNYKYYITELELSPLKWCINDINGLSISHSKEKVKICKKNKWNDYTKYTNSTINRYLMDQEEIQILIK